MSSEAIAASHYEDQAPPSAAAAPIITNEQHVTGQPSAYFGAPSNCLPLF
jgi:hypothetical protein